MKLNESVATLADSSWSRWPVLALGLRGIHATAWPLVSEQFGER